MMDRIAAFLTEIADRTFAPYLSGERPPARRKTSGEIVTDLDLFLETEIRRYLQPLYPAADIIGEETANTAAATGRGLDAGDIWLIDPLDGTGNFAAGKPDFAVMLCRMRDGATVASWIYLPATRQLAMAEQGSGVRLNGERLNPAPPRQADPVGEIHDRYLPADLAPRIAAGRERLPHCRPRYCAGATYVALVQGQRDFAFYYRTRPWDHAPGTLLIVEAGGRAARLDGTPYRAGDGRAGLLSTIRADDWPGVRDVLMESRNPRQS